MVLLKQNGFLGNPFESRDDVVRGLTSLLDALAPHTSPGGAFIEIGNTATHYDLRAVYLETFARPLWGLTSLLAGGDKYEGVQRWIDGFKNGTDPNGSEYWGEARAKDQRMVEMSPLSFAVALKPDVFYNNQDEQTKKNIAAFLETCIGKPMPDTNWLWFRVFANLALRSIGSPLFNPSQMERDLSRLEEFQFEDHPPEGDDTGSGGWSNDGPADVYQRDYYSSSFAIQFAQMTYTKLCRESDPERSKMFEKRAQKFILDFVYYFSPNGAAIPFGRSMVYRFAVISSFSALALADIPLPAPLEWGHIKGFVLRHLRSWNQSKDIFRSDGTLNIGYGYDNMNMTENYNAPGSPYWCMKAFACLAAPASHPFWTSKELEHPAALLAPIKAVPDTYHILTHSGGHTFLLSSGQKPHYAMRHGPAKYSKFGYSSTFGFSCPTGDMDLEQLSADSMIALRDNTPGVEACDGESWRVRRQTFDAEVVNRGTPKVHLRSKWRPWPNVLVETFLIPPTQAAPNWYVRVHKITSDRPLKSAEAGWSTYGQGPDGRALVQTFSGLKSGGDEEIGWTRANTKIGAVGVLDLKVPGKNGSGEKQGKLVQTDPNSNVIFSRSVLPTLMGEIKEGETWIATGVFGKPAVGGEEADFKGDWEKKPEVPEWVLQ